MRKDFHDESTGSIRSFAGEVVEYESSTRLYRIRYVEDDDSEQMEWGALRPLLSPTTPTTIPATSGPHTDANPIAAPSAASPPNPSPR